MTTPGCVTCMPPDISPVADVNGQLYRVRVVCQFQLLGEGRAEVEGLAGRGTRLASQNEFPYSHLVDFIHSWIESKSTYFKSSFFMVLQGFANSLRTCIDLVNTAEGHGRFFSLEGFQSQDKACSWNGFFSSRLIRSTQNSQLALLPELDLDFNFERAVLSAKKICSLSKTGEFVQVHLLNRGNALIEMENFWGPKLVTLFY